MAIAVELSDRLAPLDRPASPLTADEQRILALVGAGWSVAAVGEDLDMTPEAVGERLAATVEPIESLVGSDERFLGDVLRFGGTSREVRCQPINPSLVSAHEEPKSVGVAASGAFDELAIRSASHAFTLAQPVSPFGDRRGNSARAGR